MNRSQKPSGKNFDKFFFEYLYGSLTQKFQTEVLSKHGMRMLKRKFQTEMLRKNVMRVFIQKF